MKVLFTRKYEDKAIKEVVDLGYDVDYIPERDISEYRDLENIDILVCYNPFNKIDLRELKNLKLILLSSIGIDQLPKKIIKDMNITVCNNKGGYSIPMGEWIVMKILELSRNSKQHFENQRNKTWNMDTSVIEVFNKTILFFGTGTISFEAAKRLQGFDMNIIGLNSDGRDIEYFNYCDKVSNSKNHIKNADYIVIALPSTKATIGLFDKNLIDEMKSTSSLINIARGNIIDENYLIKALKEKRIKGAALDVFKEEPLDKNSEFWDVENLIINSHNSWLSEKSDERRFDKILKNLERYMNNKELINIVDVKKGY